MKDFGFYKIIRLPRKKDWKKYFSLLRDIHKDIPETQGCLYNINKEGGCSGWCCRVQTPQLLYSEFLLIWKNISEEWSDIAILELFERCMINAVDDIPSKGCIFFNRHTNMCEIHNVRPLNCRIYGITPPEEFEPRYQRLKEEYKSIMGAVMKPQCDLVSTIDGSVPTVEDTNKWWEALSVVERKIGIPKKMINDKFGGSYRTPHDHVLLYNMPENVLNALAGIKLYDSMAEKKQAVKSLVSHIREFFFKR